MNNGFITNLEKNSCAAEQQFKTRLRVLRNEEYTWIPAGGLIVIDSQEPAGIFDALPMRRISLISGGDALYLSFSLCSSGYSPLKRESFCPVHIYEH